jgi:hypothetical protein
MPAEIERYSAALRASTTRTAGKFFDAAGIFRGET